MNASKDPITKSPFLNALAVERQLGWFIPQEDLFCHEFHLVDLRVYNNCKEVVKGCQHVFNLAADMGGELRRLCTSHVSHRS